MHGQVSRTFFVAHQSVQGCSCEHGLVQMLDLIYCGPYPFNEAISIEIVDNALSLKLLSFRSGRKWPARISSDGVVTNHDTSCNAYYHAMAPPVLRIEHGNCPLPMFACDRVLLHVVRLCTIVATDKCSAPLDRHIDIDLSSRNNS